MKLDSLPFPVVPHEHPQDLIDNCGILYLVAMYILADDTYKIVSNDANFDETVASASHRMEQELEQWLDNAFDYLPIWFKGVLGEVE